MSDYHPYPPKHKRSCIDDEGKIECVCGLSESMDVYDSSGVLSPGRKQRNSTT